MIYVLVDSINTFFWVLRLMLLVRIILSWFPVGLNNKFVSILFSFTEPVLAPVRNMLRRSPLGGPGMVIDFSPLIVIILLELVRNIIVSIVLSL